MSDYISREAIKNAMLRYGFKAPDMTVTEFVEDELPAADVRPVVHGRKIEDGDIGVFYLCSLCGECLPYGANYCPYCGAKMELEDETNDD